MRRAIAVFSCALALVSCGKNDGSTKLVSRKAVTTNIPEKVDQQKKNVVIRPDVPNVLDKSFLGSKLAADGTVAEESATFKPGEVVSLTIWLKESPPGLNTGAIWYGKDDTVIAREKRPMDGGKTVTYSLKQKLKPGTYRVEGYWGGNVVADKTFEVAGGKKKK
jgi:hypothetical protein